MKIELKHLAPYLPYSLLIIEYNFDYSIKIRPMVSGDYFSGIPINTIKGDELKPILRPLSDIIKNINHNGEKFVPIYSLNKTHPLFEIYEGQEVELDNIGISYQETSISDYLYLINKLFEWHFDVFGLIEKGLAIDINSL